MARRIVKTESNTWLLVHFVYFSNFSLRLSMHKMCVHLRPFPLPIHCMETFETGKKYNFHQCSSIGSVSHLLHFQRTLCPLTFWTRFSPLPRRQKSTAVQFMCGSFSSMDSQLYPCLHSKCVDRLLQVIWKLTIIASTILILESRVNSI